MLHLKFEPGEPQLVSALGFYSRAVYESGKQKPTRSSSFAALKERDGIGCGWARYDPCAMSRIVQRETRKKENQARACDTR